MTHAGGDSQRRHPCAVGVDVGGTKIAAGLVAPDGTVSARRRIPTHAAQGGGAVLAAAVDLAAQVAADAAAQGRTVLGVGVAVCELVDPHGNVTSGHTVDWRGLPVRAEFARLAPAVVESDVRAPAAAEARFGAGAPYQLFAYVTVGTGISCALVQAGVPLAGARGNALVLATMPLTVPCPDGQLVDFVLEEYASGPALAARYAAATGRPCRQAETVLAAAAQGDADAVAVVESAGAALGSSVALLVNVTDPEAVVVGGGLGLAGGLYWNAFVASTRAHIYADDTRTLPILPAACGVDAGIIGAAAAVLRRHDTTREAAR